MTLNEFIEETTWVWLVVGSLMLFAATQACRVDDRPWFSTYHDDARGVTCWIFAQGVSCLPDSAIKETK